MNLPPILVSDDLPASVKAGRHTFRNSLVKTILHNHFYHKKQNLQLADGTICNGDEIQKHSSKVTFKNPNYCIFMQYN